MTNFDRRFFLKSIAAGSALALFPVPFRMAKAMDGETPRFFIHLVFYGGMDNSYTFDARPLKMTADGAIQNYYGKEPEVWTGANGQTSLVSELMAPLKTHRDCYSILNGVVMTPTFDGHIQNLNFLFTGNPFGGNCFMPELNRASGASTLDGLVQGRNFAQLFNMSSFIPTEPKDMQTLVDLIHKKKPISVDDPAWKFIISRYSENAGTSGRFSLTSELMRNSIYKSVDLERLMKSAELKKPKSDDPADLPILASVGELFRTNIARSALIIEDLTLDNHGVDDAKRQPVKAAGYARRVKALIEHLKSEPYDSKRSLLDVTTFMVSSEFGRTMRQADASISETGTDHNNFTNTLVLGGSGVRSNWIVGASDFQSTDERLSKAHESIDQRRVKTVGRPFDFDTLKPKSVLPEKFEIRDYLSIGSVINTVYEMNGISKDKYWKIGREEITAPGLKGLLS